MVSSRTKSGLFCKKKHQPILVGAFFYLLSIIFNTLSIRFPYSALSIRLFEFLAKI